MDFFDDFVRENGKGSCMDILRFDWKLVLLYRDPQLCLRLYP